MQYVRVENLVRHIPGFDVMRLLGASSSRKDETMIGQFGSGFLNMLALFARTVFQDDAGFENLLIHTLKVCLGKEVVTFSLKPIPIKDSRGNERETFEIYAKRQNGGSISLNITPEWGEIDWTCPTMGVREIITNACDGAFSSFGDYSSVKIEYCEENECRAKDGTIRVYFAATPEISDYIDRRNEVFICLRRDYDAKRRVFRNTTGGNGTLYRKGVRGYVAPKPSLFHYNIGDVKIDESRNVDSVNAQTAAATAIMTSMDPDLMEVFIREIVCGDGVKKYWESDFHPYYLNPDNYSGSFGEKVKKAWDEASKRVFGDAVLVEDDHAATVLEAKGKPTKKVASDYLNSIKAARTVVKAAQVLDEDEMQGKCVTEPTPEMVATLDATWDRLLKIGVTCGKHKPAVKGYDQNTQTGGSKGYHRNGVVYVNNDAGGLDMKATVIHEIAHYITGAKDYTFEFEEFYTRLAARLMWAE
jgi:hypothetical protein